MKYEELVSGLEIVKSKVILNYSGVLFEHIYQGIKKFGKVYVYPEPYHKEVKAIEDKEYYGINIEEKLWKKLQELAKKENRSASNFIEYLIEKWEKGE
mgnify:CR=1 FL=1